MKKHILKPTIPNGYTFQGIFFLEGIFSETPTVPIMGFSDMKKHLIKSSDHKEKISLKFSNLETPDDFFNFADTYGSLYENKDGLLGNAEISAITESSLLDIFKLTPGKKATGKMERVIGDSNMKNVTRYEFLSDWIISSRLLKLAFSLHRILKEDFKYENDKDDFIISTSSKTTLVVSMLKNNDVEGVVIGTGIPKNNTSYLYNDNSLKSYAINTNDYCLANYPSELVIVGFLSTNGETKTKLKQIFIDALDALFNFHLGIPTFGSTNGKLDYRFNSLLSYIWADCLFSTNQLVDISTCDYCGRPFMRVNRGKKRRFCTDLCSKNYHNNSKSRGQKGKSK
ncbi:hypothetical protein [Anaerosporobacter sp.]|uniref:hypothetical protein n=1 Tax=Anaerosporobacter sp. TaxID=1872529 RepID=UPI00286EDF20|nr:hypothetical protein [Anaerosporobacter sp.]